MFVYTRHVCGTRKHSHFLSSPKITCVGAKIKHSDVHGDFKLRMPEHCQNLRKKSIHLIMIKVITVTASEHLSL